MKINMGNSHKRNHEENNWNHITEATMVESLNEKVTREETVTAKQAMKSGKTAGSPDVCEHMVPASQKVGITKAIGLCQRVLSGIGMANK